MDTMTDPATTSCGHNFCSACLSRYIASSHYGVRCPSCRGDIQSSFRVNTGLRDMIQRFLVAPTDSSGTAATAITTDPFTDVACTVSISHTPSCGKSLVHCSVAPPADGVKQPIVALLCLDLSGSMGTSLPNPTQEKGARLFTRLDLAKHVCLTTAHMLGDNDVLCIIGFNMTSSVILKPTRMTADGKKKAEAAIKTAKADGGTNIWSALQLMNKIANKAEFVGRNIVSALLTDGETQADTSPRRGEVETYRSLTRPEKLSVFGFSYEINSKLLYQLASVSNCTFGFIPDFSMVGTVFINWMAAAISTASLEKTVIITYADGSKTSHPTGLIQFGQTRNIVLMSDTVPVSAHLEGSGSSGSTGAVALEQLSPMANARFELLNLLQFCIGQDGVGVDYTTVYRKYTASSDPDVRELMRDIKPPGTDDEGQVSMASRTPAFWTKWGKHYTRAYYTAVLQETCVNFKDPGLQIYGGKMFKDTSEAGDTIFRELPAPEPSGGADFTSFASSGPSPVSVARPTTMAAFHNAGGGCWAPGTTVQMADGTLKAIEAIEKGDMVWTPDGPARIEHLLTLGRTAHTQLMCEYKTYIPSISSADTIDYSLGQAEDPATTGESLSYYRCKVWITPWHPVLSKGAWVQPASFVPVVDVPMPVVYNMILDKGHIINVDGVLSVTLGHGFTGPVIEHAFFGNKAAVLRDISAQPGFAEGRPVFKNLKTRNDPDTGLIVGWYDDF